MKTKPILILSLLTAVLILLLIYLCKEKHNITEAQIKARTELARKDSIINAKEKIMQQQAEKVAILQLQYDSITLVSDLRAKEIKKWKDKYKGLQDSLPTLTGGQQVDLFMQTFNIGSDYVGDFIAPIQAAYKSNKSWLQLQEANGIINFQIGEIQDLQAKDSISRMQLFIQQGITDTCIEALTICKSKDKDWQALVDLEKKKGRTKFWKGLGIGGGVGVIIGIFFK